MRILFNLAGDRTKASSRVRGYWVGEALSMRGHKVGYHHVRGKLDYVRLARRIATYDVIVFQKAYSRYDPWLVRWARSLGKRVFFDIDDAPSRIMDPRVEAKAHQMMALSNGVLAGCSALVQRAKPIQKNTHLVPSGIRLENYAVAGPHHDDGPVCLGWIGNGAHYADDLISVLEAPLRAIAAEMPLRFRLVGACGEQRLQDCFGSIPGLQAELIDGVDWASPEAVADAVAPFDIGLYPLQPGAFNDFKCGFKALEYMANGLPVVASDAANHAEIVAHGLSGFILDTPEAWHATLRELCANPTRCSHMGQVGRGIVEDRFDTHRIAADLEDIFTAAGCASGQQQTHQAI